MSKVKTAGIITFHCADNFGAVLQTYALQTTINKMNVNVEIIDFQPPILTSQYKLKFDVNYILSEYGFVVLTRRIVGRLLRIHSLGERNRLFSIFRKRYLNISNETYKNFDELCNSHKKYDYYITGSDQVWNFEFDTNTNEAYFLSFAPKGALKLSYAASTGKKINEENKKLLISKLEDFDYISVREKTTHEVIKDFVESNVCLDPTLLLTKEEYIENLKLEETDSKYIFVYDLEYNAELTNLANKLSNEYNLKIITYSKDKKKYINNAQSINSKGPLDFLNYIKNSTIVITNSFHGVCFSIIFNKNFYCFPHKTKGARMVDLMEMLELNHRIIYNELTKDDINKEIDYQKANSILSQERNKSIDYLMNALSTCENNNE